MGLEWGGKAPSLGWGGVREGALLQEGGELT
ncbi:MAG: hypothetical protein RI897_3061 [Verrucomicrobiota bacterium]|jgi:hypothetical protein